MGYVIYDKKEKAFVYDDTTSADDSHYKKLTHCYSSDVIRRKFDNVELAEQYLQFLKSNFKGRFLIVSMEEAKLIYER